MSFLPTLGELKRSRITEVAASCNNSDDFRSLVNEAAEILLSRGDWPGTIVPIRVLVRAGCVVWPRAVQRVRRINACGVPIKVGSIWYDYVDKSSYLGWCGEGYYNWTGNTATNYGLGTSLGSLINQGRVPTYNDIPATPGIVRAYCLTPADVGKKITIYGRDGYNQPLQTQNPDGTLTDGAVLTLKIPYASTTGTISRIDAVLKDVTSKNVPLYVEVSTGLLDLAVYEPSETNPSYTKDRLFSYGNCNCNREFTVIALVKLAYIEAIADTDYVLIPSKTAIKNAVQSIKFGESGDFNNKQAFLQAAVDELNAVLNTESPIDQNVVDDGFGGGYQVGAQSVL